jgi:hypothetical protein
MADCSLACFVQLGINARTPQPRPDVQKVYTQHNARAVTKLGLCNPPFARREVRTPFIAALGRGCDLMMEEHASVQWLRLRSPHG